MTDTERRLEAVHERVAAAAHRSGRDAESVRVIAVTKGVEVERMAEAIAVGVGDLGESRVQEARRKQGELGSRDVNWHLLGHLQTNKAAHAAESFDAIHSIDSERVAKALAIGRDPNLDPMAALVEVELSGIETRTGVAEADAEALVRACMGLPGVHLVGLMTIAPPGAAEVARDTFRRLRQLRDRLELATRWDLPELSMGMSGDFEVAVEEGATMVRLGRVIFGERLAAP